MIDNGPVLAIAIPQIQSDEGCELTAYPDPLSGGDPYTVGYGCTGAGIGPGTVWTLDEAEADLQRRVTGICDDLDSALPWWRQLSPPRAAVLVEMTFQLGLYGLLGFPHALACAQVGNWQGAHDGMLDSRWAKSQTPGRANREATQMLTGTIQGA